MSWAREAQAALLLDCYLQAEIRRLDEKAELMRAGRFDDRAKQSDAAFRARNDQTLSLVRPTASDSRVAAGPE